MLAVKCFYVPMVTESQADPLASLNTKTHHLSHVQNVLSCFSGSMSISIGAVSTMQCPPTDRLIHVRAPNNFLNVPNSFVSSSIHIIDCHQMVCSHTQCSHISIKCQSIHNGKCKVTCHTRAVSLAASSQQLSLSNQKVFSKL